MILEIPCRVCGDKSAGINFGVISCQDCYVFFRNTHVSPHKNQRREVHHDLWKTYVCSGDHTCVVDRDNKDRCNECRYQKCNTAGMKYVKEFNTHRWTDISKTLKGFKLKVAFSHRHTVRGPKLIRKQLSEPQDDLWLNDFRSMTYEEKWANCSKLLTIMIEWIITFVRHLQLFFKVPTYQVLVSKYCMFEIIIVRISRLINLDKDLVLYGNRVIPISECVNACDPFDMEVVSGLFDVAKKIARLKLTEKEIAIYQTLLLSWPDRYIGVRQVNDFMTVLHYKSVVALREEIQKSHTPLEGDDSVMRTLMDTLYTLQSVSKKHVEALSRFEEAFPEHSYEDAELYHEIFGTHVPSPLTIRTAYSPFTDYVKDDSRTF